LFDPEKGTGEARVIRGGSWDDGNVQSNAGTWRSARRDGGAPIARRSNIGFRLAAVTDAAHREPGAR
jgi:formylglycine-generating enzyme required for sulfatase activity